MRILKPAVSQKANTKQQQTTARTGFAAVLSKTKKVNRDNPIPNKNILKAAFKALLCGFAVPRM